WNGSRLWNVPWPTDSLYSQAQMQVVGTSLVVVYTDCVSNTNAHSIVWVLDAASGAFVAPAWSPGEAVKTFAVESGVLVTSEFNDDTGWIAGYDLSGHELWRTDQDW